MTRSRIILRTLAKAAVRVVVTFVLLIGSWFAGNRLMDEPPDMDRVGFLTSADDDIPDYQNIAVGMLGITAPMGSDIMKYGSKVAEAYRSNSSSEQIEGMIRGPEALLLTVDSDKVWCWLDPYGPRSEGCLPFEEAPRILRENAELLKRYRYLHQLTQHSNIYSYFNRESLTILKLAVAEIHVHLERGEFDAAYEKWRDQLRFSKNLLRGTDSWVGKAIGLVTFGFTLPLLENILIASPDLAQKHQDELLSLLQIDGIDAFGLDGVMRAEYSILKRSLESPRYAAEGWSRDRLYQLTYHLGQRQRILNRYYEFSLDYLEALHKPWSNIDKEMSRLEDKHVFSSIWNAVIDPFGTLFLWVYFDGQLKARELLTSMHAAIGRLRLATLYVRIINAEVDDNAISDFIESAGSAYNDPFTETPMKWDPEKRRIFFPNQENQCAVYESFRLPDKNSREPLQISRSNRSLC